MFNICNYLFGPVCCGAPTVHIEDVSPGTTILNTNFVAPGIGPAIYEPTTNGSITCPEDCNATCCGPEGLQQLTGPQGCLTITRQMGVCGAAGCEGCFAGCCGPNCCSCGPEGFFGQCCGPVCCSQVCGPEGICSCGCGENCGCCAFDLWTNCFNCCGPEGCCGIGGPCNCEGGCGVCGPGGCNCEICPCF